MTKAKVLNGIDQLDKLDKHLRGRRVGIVSGGASIDRNNRHTVDILCESNQHDDEMMVSTDGQDPFIVLAGDHVVVRQAPEKALLVKLGLVSFYDRLREKLQWGGGV
jgi:uncharacterized protein YbbC (DUF1343 family)